MSETTVTQFSGNVWPELATTLDARRLTSGAQSFVQAVADRPDLPVRLAKMALVFKHQEQKLDARLVADAARKLAPDDFRVRALTDWTVRREAPLWHFSIIHDTLRNEAYARALNHFVQPGMTVFEIGTGTGILAMLAAQAGAKHVYTCERRAEVAEAAREIIALNGFSDRITVISKDASSLILGVDLPERADLFVAEIVDDTLLGEQVLSLTELARTHFLKPDAILLPHTVSAIGCLVSGESHHKQYRMDTVMGFQLTPFNRFTPIEISGGKGGGGMRTLSEPAVLAQFDLRYDVPAEGTQRIELKANVEGVAEGIMRWLRLDFGAGIVFENQPPQVSSWRPQLHVLPQSRPVTPGDVFAVDVSHIHDRLFLIPQS